MPEDKDEDGVNSISDAATSSETLSDIEETEDASDKAEDSAEAGPLTPDGAEKSDNIERQPKDDSGPM